MAEILTYNTPASIEKKKVKENSPWYISKSVYSWFRTQDKFTKTYVIVFLMIAVATPYIVSQYLNFSQKAAPLSVKESSSLRVGIVSPAKGELVKSNSSTAIVANVPDVVKVGRVQFSVNGILVCTVSTPPYICDWKVPSGSGIRYSITTKATGLDGSSAIDMTSVASE